jgi:hypothetical protein
VKRALAFSFFFALIAAVALAASRPPSDFALNLMLYGHPTRFVMADGGVSGMYGTGLQCMPITGGKVYLLEGHTNFNLCVRPTPDGVTWDGGCNHVIGDLNFGTELPARTPQYVTPWESATHFCQVTDAGTGSTAVWRMY